MRIRKNQKTMNKNEWNEFIGAILAMHGANADMPAYRDFVALHVDAFDPQNMSWGVHSHHNILGTYFLAWHRQYLFLMEERLMKENQNVTIPYWDSVTDRSIPEALKDPKLINTLSRPRYWNPSHLPNKEDLDNIIAYKGSFKMYQSGLERFHGAAHNAVGGDMASTHSPADPIFWLHHSYIDKLWADWQNTPHNQNPPNLNTSLKPSTFSTNNTQFSVKVGDIINISDLGYQYQ